MQLNNYHSNLNGKGDPQRIMGSKFKIFIDVYLVFNM